jgi:hypothetical protein
MTDETPVRLDVSRNPDVIAAAAKALWRARDEAMDTGNGWLSDLLEDVYGMLFVEVDD